MWKKIKKVLFVMSSIAVISGALLSAGMFLGANLKTPPSPPLPPVQPVKPPKPQILTPGERIIFSNSAGWGSWSEAKFCPPGHYVCGLAQSVEPYQKGGDDTAMNAVAFYCCPGPLSD